MKSNPDDLGKGVIFLPDMTAILTDPELGGTTFTVERTTWQRAGGEAIPKATVQFEMTGCIHPGTPEQLEQLPEEDRQEEFIVIYAPGVLSLGENNGITFTGPDRIRWRDQEWRVVRLKPWTAFGFVQAYAVLVTDLEVDV